MEDYYSLANAIQRQYDALNGPSGPSGEPPPPAPPDKPVFGHYVTPQELKTMNARATMPFASAKDMPLGSFTSSAPPQAPKPPTKVETPISDMAQRVKPGLTPLPPAFNNPYGKSLVAPFAAVAEQMGRGAKEGWEEGGVGNAPTSDAIAGLPAIGLTSKVAASKFPQVKEALKTPLGDVPGLGLVARGVDAAWGAINAGAEVIGRPANVAMAMMRESNTAKAKAFKNPVLDISRELRERTTGWATTGVSKNPQLFADAGTTPEEADKLIMGLLTGQNTPAQAKRLEEILNTGKFSEEEANPVSSAVMTSVFDPLTYVDVVGGILPMMSEIQGVRKMWQAGGDITKARDIKGVSNPLNELIAKAFQPADVPEGVMLSRKAVKIVEPQDTTVLSRTINAFRKTPVAQTIENVQRAADNLIPYLNDTGRELGEKVTLLKTIRESAKQGKQTPELLAAMKQWGIKNSEDFGRVLHAIGNYDPTPVLERYERALKIQESLAQTTRTAKPGFNPQVAEFAQSEADNLGGGYKDAFTRIIDGWKAGKLDLDEMRVGIEKVAGVQLSADVTAQMSKTLAGIAKIQPPNPITHIVNFMKRYEGLLFVGANPASMVQNVVNDMSTIVRKGGALRTEGQADEFFARHGLAYNDNLGNQVKRDVGSPIEAGGAYGSTAPNWTRKIPILKQMGEAFDHSQLIGRKIAYASGVERQLNTFVAPALPPRVKAFLGKDAARVEAALAKARNNKEVTDILFKNVKTWAHYTDEVADELKTLFSEVAGRDLPITAKETKGALPIHAEQNMNRVLREAGEAVQRGEDPTTAFQNARRNVYRDDIPPDAVAPTVPSGPKPTEPPGGAGAAQSLDTVEDLERRRGDLVSQWNQANNAKGASARKLADDLMGEIEAVERELQRRASELKPARAKPVEQVIEAGRPSGETVTQAVETPPVAPAAPAPNVIEQVKQRAAAITQPIVDAPMLRKMLALAESDPKKLTKVPAINPNAPLESAQELIAVARAGGQKWVDAMADLFQQTAQYRHWQIEQGLLDAAKTEEVLDRMANADALIKMLTANQRGLMFDELAKPSASIDDWYKRWYAERGEQFPRPVKRREGSAGQRADELAAKYQPRSRTSVAAGTGESVGTPAGTSAATGESGVVNDVAQAAPDDIAFVRSGVKRNPDGSWTLGLTTEARVWRRGNSFATRSITHDDNIGIRVPSDVLQRAQAAAKQSGDDWTDLIAKEMGWTWKNNEGWVIPKEQIVPLNRQQAHSVLKHATSSPTVPPASEGGMTLDAGEPQPLDSLAAINAERFKAAAERMKQAGPQSVLDSDLNKEALDALEQALLDRLGKEFGEDAVKQANVMPPDVQAEANNYIKGQFMPALNNELVKAQAMGRFFQDSTVLNYDGAWNIETALLLERPFVHWWLHAALNYTRDFIDHPAALAFALHLSDNLQKESERLIAEKKLPERFRGTFKLTLPIEMPGLGDTLWINPMRPLFPYEDTLQLNALQRAQYSDGEGDLGGVINDVFGVHLPIKLGWNALAQDWDEFQNTFASIPLNRLLKAGTGIGIEGKYDKPYQERAMKELVAEGKITEEDAKVALLTHKGAAWDAIQGRANAENYSVKEASAIFGARGKVYTPGEQKYHESSRAKEQLLDNAVRQLGGNPDMDEAQRYEFLSGKGFYGSPDWLQFKEEHPETDMGKFLNAANAPQAEGAEGLPDRLPEDEAQQARAKSYYLDAIQEKYYSVPELKQKLIAADLGDQFKTLFLNKETKDWESIPLKTVLGWANAMDILLQDPIANTQMPQPEPYKVTFTNDDQNKRYQAMYDEVGQSYGWQEYAAGWDKYWALKEQNPDQAKAFLNSAEGKKLTAVSDTVNEFFKENPDLQNILEKAGLRKPTAANTTPTQGQALNQAVIAAGLNWDDINKWKEEYNKLPKGTGARTKYLAQRPGLLRYFQLSGAIYNTDEELQQNNKPRSSNTPNFRYTPERTYYGKTYGGAPEKKPGRIYLNFKAVGGGGGQQQQGNGFVPRRMTPGGY